MLIIDTPDGGGRRKGGEAFAGGICDGCSKQVSGAHYRCMKCPEYHLCGDCKIKKLHAEHKMIRTSKPDTTIPRQILSRERINKVHDVKNSGSASLSTSAGKQYKS